MEFDQLYQQYNQVIYRLCLGYTNDPHLAKDMVQETFLAVWKNLKKFRGDSQISTWIYRIAVNNCIRQIEKEKKQRISKNDYKVDSNTVEESAKTLLLRKLIAALPEIDRLLISLELEEIPQVEIAEILGISHSNVRVRIHRIKEVLSNNFKSLGYV